MSIQNFVPTVWTARLFQELDKAHVFVARCNRDYEGEISQYGDTVKITGLGDVSVANYVPNTTSITPQQLDAAQTTLAIDKAKYFAFKIDDVDNAQTKPKLMGEAMRKSAYALRDASDTDIAELGSEAGNTHTETVTTALAIPVLGEMARKLDEANVPPEGRWLVAPPWLIMKFALAEILETDGSVNAQDTFNNGFAGRAMGFDVYSSNNVKKTAAWAPSVPVHEVLAGHPRAITFAQQILGMEAYRPESSFSDAVKGLYVYGYKVVDPNALVKATLTYSSS